MSEVNEKTPLLEVRNLRKLFAGKSSFFQKDKSWIKAVDDVSFTLNPKETLGVVGESGCGKSTMGRSVLRLIEPTSGEIFYKGKDFTKASGQELRKMRADMQIIFQDPYASLNPRMTIGEIIAEPLNIQKRYKTQEETRAQVLKVMEVVGLNTKYYNRYPHEFSGGQRQRIGLARAMVMDPELVVAGIRAGCFHPVSGTESAAPAAGIHGNGIYLHFPQLKRYQAHFRPCHGYVSGTCGRAGGQERAVCEPVPSVHPGAAVRNSGTGAPFQEKEDHSPGRSAEPGKPAVRMYLPHPLLHGSGNLFHTEAGAQRYRRRSSVRLSFLQWSLRTERNYRRKIIQEV